MARTTIFRSSDHGSGSAAHGVEPNGSTPFHLPADIRIGTVVLQVADLDRSLAYYGPVLGFRLLGRNDTRGARSAALGAAGSESVLLQLHERPGAHPIPRRGRLGLYHFAVLLPTRADLGRFLRHVSTLGVRVGSSDHLVSEATYLVDPDGITIEVYRDRPRSEWPRQNGEIVLDTIPLDTHGVLGSAGDEPWQGLPSGTTIGHMHFYVGDLEAAHAFYESALGFERTYSAVPGALFVSAGGYHHHVGLNTWAAGAPVAGDDDVRLLTWDLVLPDRGILDTTAGRLRRAGYPVESADGGSISRDPWGIAVRLIAG